jgi:predicted dienelactone hydrolase
MRYSALAVVVGAAVVIALVVGHEFRSTSAHGSAPPAHSSPTTAGGRPPPRSTPSTTPPAPASVPRGTAVTVSTQPLDDPTRPLTSDGVELDPTTNLPLTIWRPVAAGAFPLVVFVHGYDRGPADYARFCSTLASAGYIVVAPSFPLEDPAQGHVLDRSDLPDEATDVHFVITSVLDGPLAAHIDARAIAVVGHSDGADVALMVGYQAGLVDVRVRAVVAVAPDAMTGAIATPPVAPLLLVQGNADSVVPYANSQTVFGQVPARRYYLTLLGADHLPPIAGGTPWTPVLDTAVADFLDATIAGRASAGSALTDRLGASPLVQLRVAG